MAQQYGTPATQDPEIYFELAAQLGKINEQCKRQDAALASAKEKRALDDFEREYATVLENLERKKCDVKKTADFKSFKEQLLLMKQALEDAATATSGGCATRVEDDDFVMQSEINVFDPLTKQRMKNPVCNQVCGHHYEKSTILEAIGINKFLRCPVAGCGNKQHVLIQHLQEDNLFKLRLQQMADKESED